MTSQTIIAATLASLRHLASPGAPTAEFGPEIDWEEMVAFASAQLVLPALHPATGAPADAAEFIAGVHAANSARNATLRECLAGIGRALNACGIEPVLLKGAGWLATAGAAPPAWRFLSDLDLLVPQARLAEAVAAACKLGFISQDADYDPARDAHFPALIAPGGQFAVELHTRLFADRTLPLLEARLPSGAQAIVVDGAVYLMPALADRLAHLIAHAQLHHGHFRAKRLLLRGFLEFSMLTGSAPESVAWSDVFVVFASRRQRDAAGAFLAAWRMLMAPVGDGPPSTYAEAAWARSAHDRLGRNSRARAIGAALAATGAGLARALREPDVLARHLATIAKPRALAKRLGRHRERLKQAYWA